jgi:hypothetical protein
MVMDLRNWKSLIEGLALDLAYILVLQIMTFFLYSSCWSEPIAFPSKMMSCRFNLDFSFFGVLDPRPKVMDPIYDFQLIGSLYFIKPRTLDPHLKWHLTWEFCIRLFGIHYALNFEYFPLTSLGSIFNLEVLTNFFGFFQKIKQVYNVKTLCLPNFWDEIDIMAWKINKRVEHGPKFEHVP